MSRIRSVMPLILCALVSSGVVAAQATPAPLRPIAVVLDDAAPATSALAAKGLSGLGGRVIHTFDQLLVVELPSGSELRAYRLRGVREVILNASPLSSRKASAPLGIAGWNGIARVEGDRDRPGLPVPALEADALTPPVVSIESVRAASETASRLRTHRGAPDAAMLASAGAPYGATSLNTSEFLAGSVSLNVFLVESDGRHEISTENWTAAREAEVVGKIAAGLEWIRNQEPQAALRFVYHVYAGRTDPRARTGYEPIRRAADPSGPTGEDLWVKEVLAKFGYESGDRFARSRAFAADTRAADGTDWAVNIFVADSYADSDGKFADGRFAYTWIGGPHVVMTYDNQAWGIDRLDMVLRHELLHAFYTFDEYAVSFCSCTEHRGYLDGVNANCVSCNAQAAPCVMISNGDALCTATRRQLGWADLDGDGKIDVIGEDPDTFLDAVPQAACPTPVLSGMASVVAATNRNSISTTPRASISVNRIASVEVRADEAPWVDAQALGGGFGEPQGQFTAGFPALAAGVHRLEARAVDDHGNADLDPAGADVTVFPALAPLGASVRTQKSGNALVMSWDACDGAARYRVYRSATPGSAGSLAKETPGTSWSDAAEATAYYRVRPVDGCGGEGSD